MKINYEKNMLMTGKWNILVDLENSNSISIIKMQTSKLTYVIKDSIHF